MTPTREERGIGRARPIEWSDSPFGVLQRFADEMDRMFDGFGLGRGWSRSPQWSGTGTAVQAWAPDVDVFQKNDQLIIKADLPGLNKDDISVDITEDAVTIQGERKSEREEQREGVYRTERSYGRFCRVVPLPTGAMSDQAKATFRDGVLEISMPSPPAATRGRRLEITEGAKK
jgi:HSP20 family protein